MSPGDHAELSKFAAGHNAAHLPHRWIEGVGMADDQINLGFFDRGDDRIAIVERQRHRLFQNDVFAVLGGKNGVRRMELMRCRDVDGLDGRIGAQRGYVIIDFGVEIAGESFTRRGVGFRSGDDADARMFGGGTDHHRARHAEPDNAEADWPAGLAHQAGSPAASRSRSTQTSSP